MKSPPLHQWLRFSVFNGFAASASYISAIFLPLPEKISLLLSFAFGPFFMLASLGIFYIIRSWKDSMSLRAGVLFNITGTAFLTMMLVVQQSSFSFHEKFKTGPHDGISNDQLTWMFKEVNSIQLGMDVTWDIFISAGTFLLALSFYGHPVLKRIFPVIGMLSAVILFSFNLAYFPVPPGEAGSIDFGPFVATWYLILTVFVLIKRKKISSSLPGVFTAS